MGFRDLNNFNKALLAKQVWRMIEYPSHMVARVFKARYLKNTDIMDALLGTNPSYIWRFLRRSRDILHKGTFWKIGNGEKVNARRDAWIPDLHSGRITSNITIDNDVMVKDIMLPSREWDYNKIENLFLPYKSEAIMKVPIRVNGMKDTKYWKYEKEGSYYVRTGYWMNSDSQPPGMRDFGNAGSNSSIKKICTKIWNL